MGDHAQDAFDRAMDETEDLHSYHIGSLTAQEAYDRGIIDEMGHEDSVRAVTRSDQWGFLGAPPAQPKKTVTCRNCGKTGLSWMNVEGAWRVSEGGELHNCYKPAPAPRLQPLSENQVAEAIATISGCLRFTDDDARKALRHLAEEIARLESEVKIQKPLFSKRVLQEEMERVVAALPPTYYSDRTPSWRVAKIADDWNRAVRLLTDVDEREDNLHRQVSMLQADARSLETELSNLRTCYMQVNRALDVALLGWQTCRRLAVAALRWIPRGTEVDMEIRKHLGEL